MDVTLSSPAPVLAADMILPFNYDTYFIRDVGDSTLSTPDQVDPAWYPRSPDVTDEWNAVQKQWAGAIRLLIFGHH